MLNVFISPLWILRYPHIILTISNFFVIIVIIITFTITMIRPQHPDFLHLFNESWSEATAVVEPSPSHNIFYCSYFWYLLSYSNPIKN